MSLLFQIARPRQLEWEDPVGDLACHIAMVSTSNRQVRFEPVCWVIRHMSGVFWVSGNDWVARASDARHFTYESTARLFLAKVPGTADVYPLY